LRSGWLRQELAGGLWERRKRSVAGQWRREAEDIEASVDGSAELVW
jgi:hypothetical protein